LCRGIPLNFREQFFPLGTVVEIQSNHKTVLETARLSFGRYGDPPPRSEPEFLIQLCVDPERHDDPSRVVPRYRALSHLFHIGCGEASFAVADLTKDLAIGFISSEIAHDTSFFRYVFLECLFHVLAVHRNHTPVHCACVALDGQGALICGPSGAGKTTLAYACIKAGLQFVSDDTVHLRRNPGDDKLLLWGNPWTLRLLPDATGIFPELRGKEMKPRNGHPKCLEIDVSRHFSEKALISCRPAVLIFLQRDPATCQGLRPLPKDAALRHLSENIVLDEEAVVRRHQEVLQRLVAAETYQLNYSGSPSNAVEWVHGLLQPHCSQSVTLK